MIIKYETWATMKALVDAGANLQYEDRANNYTLFLHEGTLTREHILWKEGVAVSGVPASNTADLTEFEDSYKLNANKPILPSTGDGRPVVNPDIFRNTDQIAYTSRGDDIAGGVLWGGEAFFDSPSGPASTSVKEWQFKDYTYLAGGMFSIKGSDKGDWFDYRIYAPSSVSAETTNVGAGAFDKTPIGGGINMYIPNAANTGSHDLDLVSKLNGNVDITKVVPIPARDADGDKSGYFDWDKKTNLVTLSTPGAGGYYLFDQPKDLSRFIVEARLVDDEVLDLRMPSMQPKLLLPHWIHKMEYSRTDAGTVDIAWQLLISRKDTA